jgi:hypothetical protein
LISGRPISSQASRRAVWKAVSDRVSALPGGFVKLVSFVGEKRWWGHRSKPRRKMGGYLRLHSYLWHVSATYFSFPFLNPGNLEKRGFLFFLEFDLFLTRGKTMLISIPGEDIALVPFLGKSSNYANKRTSR